MQLVKTTDQSIFESMFAATEILHLVKRNTHGRFIFLFTMEEQASSKDIDK